MKILFTGGGTLGPVTPLLAVVDVWRKKDPSVEFVWVGTRHGPERKLITEAGIRFFDLPVARLPRFVSVEWLILPFKLFSAFYKAIQIIRFQKPDLVGSAGGYTAVPIILAAKMFRVPVWVHQQDVELILTNKLTAPLANVVTLAWEQSRKGLPKKAVLVGNPVRPAVRHGSPQRVREALHIHSGKPVLLVFGGGTGARWINEMFASFAKDLVSHASVIHLTGRNKMIKGLNQIHEDYHALEFATDQMPDLLAVADVVVSRAGLATITELSALSKATIMIPLPHSPQVANMKALGDAVIAREEGETSAQNLYETVTRLLDDPERRIELGKKLHKRLDTDAANEIIELLEKQTHL